MHLVPDELYRTGRYAPSEPCRRRASNRQGAPKGHETAGKEPHRFYVLPQYSALTPNFDFGYQVEYLHIRMRLQLCLPCLSPGCLDICSELCLVGGAVRYALPVYATVRMHEKKNLQQARRVP